MTTELAPRDPLAETLAAWLSGRSERTRLEYAKDLRRFADWRGAESVRGAVAELLGSGAGPAHLLVRAYKGWMMDAGAASATVNRRLAVVRSVVSIAQQSGLVDWSLHVPGVPKKAALDVRGPSWAKFGEILAAEPSARNRAILGLLGQRGLRCAEVLGVRLEDVGADGALTILGKGRREPEVVTLASETSALVAAWIVERGRALGPLFDLDPSTVRRMVETAGRRVGLDVNPHALRHTAITRALTVTGGDVRAVRLFSRHADIRTVAAYDDARQDMAGQVARRVVDAGAADGPTFRPGLTEV